MTRHFPITGTTAHLVPHRPEGADVPQSLTSFASPSTKRFAESEGQNGGAGKLANASTPFTPHGPRPMCADCGRGFYGCICEPDPDPEIHAAEQRVLASLGRIDWCKSRDGSSWMRAEAAALKTDARP